MTRSRIAIFEGYNAPRSSFGRPSARYGAPLFQNPRLHGLGRPLGRRGYVVPPLYGPAGYGPDAPPSRRGKSLRRAGYRVKKGPNSPWQRKFKKIAKTCARVARGKRKGTYQSCMRKKLKGKRSRK